MGDFFHGWRRKTGCVTLLLALVFMAGWARSTTLCDFVTLCGTDTYYYSFVSIDGSLVVQPGALQVEMPQNWWGGVRKLKDFVFLPNRLFIPYWTLILPLTVISACLLLSKQPRSMRKSPGTGAPDRVTSSR